eukprot:751546-Hanusia_phi.AAC.3
MTSITCDPAIYGEWSRENQYCVEKSLITLDGINGRTGGRFSLPSFLYGYAGAKSSLGGYLSPNHRVDYLQLGLHGKWLHPSCERQVPPMGSNGFLAVYMSNHVGPGQQHGSCEIQGEDKIVNRPLN